MPTEKKVKDLLKTRAKVLFGVYSLHHDFEQVKLYSVLLKGERQLVHIPRSHL
jgi:hypothetical protein